ncbi:hypothetical protein LB105_003362 [Salmonella enterica]|uniref:Uncharacterized protein n=1 Tax=Salmonella enterica subsp. enterica serovar Panama TaxID=29472 RepID=A0A5U8JCV7_SALET|nr:hypothetical protein [Salmonella enterica]EBR7993327.1 hypothetical protein [Salmonella enterica subsp. enterica serovar Panama]EBW7149684.1 hypothetical protein [Salmonella enterica subsp. enterica serovar Coeln]ECC9937719.1 hypothetical protein [Salmonella enterica subsp. enterica]ECS8449391.1 hypothetical protein [Salmonella enterica subsp. enterica serovar Uganda]EDI5553136.1 hypothetical protein [Salmonella enterica subsp. enterica serovar Poona]EEN2094708.1 hypothetical protein [Salm
MWVQIAYYVAVLVASYFISVAVARKNQGSSAKPETADNWEFPQAQEGTAQCIFFGDCWTQDWFVLAYGNYRYAAIKK